MPRELMGAAAAPAMGPSAKSLQWLVKMNDLKTKVFAAWAIWVLLRQLQSFFGPWRRSSRQWFVQYVAMAAYYFPTPVAFYAANTVYSSSDSDFKIEFSFGCAILLFACARGAVTMTAFTLDHGPDRLKNWRLLPWLVYFASIHGGSIWFDGQLTVPDVSAFLLFIGPVLYVLLAKPRAAVLDYETKQFADYMAKHKLLFDGDANNLYDGCRYPFMKLGDDRWINFSDVLELLTRDDWGAVDRDNCLSYIFCRLLARRYFGFPCAEDGNTQVRDFVLTELLADYDRAFTIVQVQLALLHDYFFTNFLSDIATGLVSVKQVVGELFVMLLPTAMGFITGVCSSSDPSSDVTVGLLFAWNLMFLVIRQPRRPFLPRYWHPIRNLILYLPTVAGSPSGDQSAAPSFGQQNSRSSYIYWRDKMGQYSVMEDYDRGLSLKAVLAWFKRRLLSQGSYSFIKHHPAKNKDVSVSHSLKKFLAHTIKDLNGPPTIGARSLDDFSWTCRQDDTLTDTILIWHIATCYCDMSRQTSTRYREVATTLSRYCAYLVAFLPGLVPEHSLTVKVVLQQVLQEPRDLLGTTRMSVEEKRVKIQQHQLPEQESNLTTFEKGIRLGRQLEQEPNASLRWKAMADFWADMILYMASSSDNGAAHIELLAQGGEFLTHIWALLSNAGILKRTTEEQSPQQPGAHAVGTP